MKTLSKGATFHIETPNGIIQIKTGLTDMLGRSVDSISIRPNNYKGEPKVKLIAGKYNQRLIELKTINK